MTRRTLVSLAALALIAAFTACGYPAPADLPPLDAAPFDGDVDGPPPDNALVAFSFAAADNSGLSTDVTATIAGSSINLTLPTGTSTSALVARFQTTAGSTVTVGGLPQVSGTTPNDFSAPVTYRLTAAGAPDRDYTVTATVAPPTAKELTAFGFTTADNIGLASDVTGVITGSTIAVSVPFGTTVTGLVARFETTGVRVSVGAAIQTSGVTVNDFTGPLTYTVTAGDNSTRSYVVTVTVAPSPLKDLTSFGFAAVHNPALSTDVAATITGTDIAITVPFGTPATGLVANFTTTGANVRVGATTQTSGATANDFTGPVTYVVTAADGSTKSYVVRVTVASRIMLGPTTDVGAGANPVSVAAAELNGDGRLDLAVVDATSSQVSVYLNTTAPGAATLTLASKLDFATGAAPRAIAFGDINGDGRPDLAVANSGSASATVLLNVTAAGATTPAFAAHTDFAAAAGASAIQLADLNGDGKLDLAVANTTADSISVLLGTTVAGAATPTFAAKIDVSSGDGPIGLAIDDINGDGRRDLAVANSTGTLSVLLNTTAIGATAVTFAPRVDLVAGSSPSGLAASDVNGDGRPDLIASNSGAASVSVLLNTTTAGSPVAAFAATGDFAAAAGPAAVTATDLDGDGRPDLAVANAGAGSVSLLQNRTAPGATTPTFAPRVDGAFGPDPRAVIAADLNGDRHPDLAMVRAAGLTLRTNTTPWGRAFALAPRTDVVVGDIPSGAAIVDLNRDWIYDVAALTSGASANMIVRLGTTPAGALVPTFGANTTLSTHTFINEIESGDLNGDGRPDLVVSNYGLMSVSVLLNTTPIGAANPTFGALTDFGAAAGPTAIELVDINGDGRLDLMIDDYLASRISVALNSTAPGAAAPTFGAAVNLVTGTNPSAITIGDFNGDGRVDVASANLNDSTVSVLLNTTAPGAASPSFASKVDFPTTASATCSGIEAGDLNGDGKLDLAVTNFDANTVSVLLGTTPPGANVPTFATHVDYPTMMRPNEVALPDVNGDGRLDLAVTSASTDSLSVYLNTTPVGATVPSFASAMVIATDDGPQHIELGDYNRDGMIDMGIVSNPHDVSFFMGQ